LALEQAFVAADKSAHDLKSFDCSKTGMNEFLARFAIKHNKLGLSRTWERFSRSLSLILKRQNCPS
tara:strand:+ start:1085 stop:1282 length:198 start_codon:yes stop_codon:yes gene_type:complete